jgi:hypothetical protein
MRSPVVKDGVERLGDNELGTPAKKLALTGALETFDNRRAEVVRTWR